MTRLSRISNNRALLVLCAIGIVCASIGITTNGRAQGTGYVNHKSTQGNGGTLRQANPSTTPSAKTRASSRPSQNWVIIEMFGQSGKKNKLTPAPRR